MIMEGPQPGDPEGAIYITYWHPPEVTEPLTAGSNCYVGTVDESTVCKYPLNRDDKEAVAEFNLEAKILRLIGPHKHIIGFKGQTRDGDGGILLEKAHYGSVQEYLKTHHPDCQQLLRWCRQVTEALVDVHQYPVLHRDIAARNMLLDSQLDVKLCDFQGYLLGPNGEVLESGNSCEGIKSMMPRDSFDYAGWDTEIFALGSAFYYIMTGHEPFPDLDSRLDELVIKERFIRGQYPEVEHVGMNDVVHKCWAGKYASMQAVLNDLSFAEDNTQLVGKQTAADDPFGDSQAEIETLWERSRSFLCSGWAYATRIALDSI